MNKSDAVPIVTVDGPSGSGKGTLSHALAARLKWHFLDSGALYRVLGFATAKRGIDWEDEECIAALARDLPVMFQASAIWLDQEDITLTIRTEQCGAWASQVAAWPKVREALIERQRAFKKQPGLVADGRDMGTVIFPEAKMKVFLEASPEERAKRRQKQLKAQGLDVSLGELFADICARDKRDRERAVSPLVPALDALILDTTLMGIDVVFQRVLQEGERRGLWQRVGDEV